MVLRIDRAHQGVHHERDHQQAGHRQHGGAVERARRIDRAGRRESHQFRECHGLLLDERRQFAQRCSKRQRCLVVWISPGRRLDCWA